MHLNLCKIIFKLKEILQMIWYIENKFEFAVFSIKMLECFSS
jgi:hypothetical protein